MRDTIRLPNFGPMGARGKSGKSSMKGVRVVFIGQSADNARVQAVVQPTGAEYIFVEAK